MKISNGKLNLAWLIVISTMVAATFFMVILCVYGINENRHYDITVTPADNIWYDGEGNNVRLSSLPKGEGTYTCDVSGIDLKNMRLCTKTVDTYFDLYADGEQIYSYRYIQFDFTGKSYGMNMHLIPLPEGTKELKLSVEPIFPENAPKLNDCVIADPGMYMGEFFSNGLLNFCLCVIILIIGIATIILGLCGIMKEEFVSLGLFAVFTALWSVNDTMYLQILTQKPELVRVLSYLSFILISFPPVAFISKITGAKSNIPLVVFSAAMSLHLFATMFLAICGIMDFHYSVHMSRVLIIAAMIMCVIMTVDALRKKKLNKRLLVSISAGVGCAVVGAATDLLRYALMDNVAQSAGLYTRLGIFAFLLIFIGYIFSDYSKVRIESSKAEVMEKLAYTDALTGLKNRLAFNEKETELKNEKNSGAKCVIVQLDINNLKKVNDVFGHSEGDRHIRAAADIISRSFKDSGICYRTGGDEFITVLSPCGDVEGVKKAIEQMIALSAEYNETQDPPVKLEIAYGYALCTDTVGELELTELLADQRMYDCKQKMKSEKS